MYGGYFSVFHQLHAFNQVFILDVDDSYKASEIVLSHYGLEELVLTKNSGVHLILPILNTQFEHPDPTIKHSLFTYWILESMKKRISKKMRKNFIPILELQNILESNEDYEANISEYKDMFEKLLNEK